VRFDCVQLQCHRGSWPAIDAGSSSRKGRRCGWSARWARSRRRWSAGTRTAAKSTSPGTDTASSPSGGVTLADWLQRVVERFHSWEYATRRPQTQASTSVQRQTASEPSAPRSKCSSTVRFITLLIVIIIIITYHHTVGYVSCSPEEVENDAFRQASKSNLSLTASCDLDLCPPDPKVDRFMQTESIHTIYRAVVIAKLMYASSA